MELSNYGKLLSTQELLEAQAHVWNHIFNFINSMSLKCAVQLNIPDIIHKHGKPIKLSELVNALLPMNHPTKSQSIYRLMRILVHSKFFIKVKINDEEGYWLTPASHLLLRDEPSSMAPFLLAMLEPVMTDPLHCLSEWFQSEHEATFSMAHGMTFWEYAKQEPKLNHFFNEAMASDARLVSGIIVKDCKQVFYGINSLVDVAGGTGTVAKAIATAFPGINCTVLDLPHVVAGLEGSEINLTYVGGNMFESIPPADAVLLKWALECWNDEECVKILKKCKEAIPDKEKGGKVIIIDMVVDETNVDDKAIETQLFFDIMLMIYITGRERTEKEWAKLFIDAGFTTYKITPALGLRSVIEVFP
ncbi:hypothetical protein ACJIZ3_009591 [Penstemon smallii]|uniref:O-methyltransferase n=1 Tax=Penstemon smallii TaxID=265156 RepID=A0ABD3TDS2_9LAMI